MKTISTLLASFFLTTSLFAADYRSTATLTVKSATRSDIVVVVDNQRYDLGTSSVMISGLDACDHDVTVYQEKNDNSVNGFEKSYNILFQSSVELKPKTDLQISIDDCGVITMNEIRSRNSRSAQDWSGSTVYNYSYNGFSSSPVYSKAISPSEFNRVLSAIGRESFEANRMKSVEQIIHTNYLTVGQVKQLLQLFCSDENKLELAKLAYDKTVDQSNYYSMNDVFKSDNSRDEWARCIRH